MGYAPVSLIATAPEPADAGTTLSVSLDTGDRFPAVPFTGLIFPVQTIPERGVDSEEVTVTEIDGDAFTFVRGPEPIDITTGLQIAALRSIPVYSYGEEIAFTASFPSDDAPYRLRLRDPEGGTVILDATDGGAGSASVAYEANAGGLWNARWEGDSSFLPESSFFVRFSNVLP